MLPMDQEPSRMCPQTEASRIAVVEMGYLVPAVPPEHAVVKRVQEAVHNEPWLTALDPFDLVR